MNGETETAAAIPPDVSQGPAAVSSERPVNRHLVRGKGGQFVPRARPVEGAPVDSGSEKFTSTNPAGPAAEPVKPVASTVPAGPAAVPDFSDVRKITGESGPAAPGVPFAPVEVVEGLSHEASAEAYLRGGYAVCDAIFVGRGEWQPDGISEHNGLKDTFVAWQKARHGKPLPPGGAFAAAAFAYVCKRARSPNTAKTLVRWFPGLASVLGVDVPAEPKKNGAVNGKPAATVPAAVPAIERGGASTVRPESYFGS